MKAVIACAAIASLALGLARPSVSAYEEPITAPQRLCLYYGYPSYVNGGGGDVAAAAAQFMNCDVVVLGDGVEHPEHEENRPAAQIIAALNDAGKQVYGYVDLGVTTVNLDIATMQRYADEWRALGAEGVFLDDAGYDYGVTRARQDALVDYVHQLGLRVFVNAWNIDDVLADVDELQRPSPSRLQAGDWYLAESWLVGGGAYMSLGDWAAKADKALGYARAKGVHIAGVSTAAVNKAAAGDYKLNKFKMGWWGAAMYGLHAWQWTDSAYSSANDVLRFYDRSGSAYGSQFTAAGVTHGSGMRVHTRTTNTGKITVQGDGVSKGTGFFR
jgi:hypothetical protein